MKLWVLLCSLGAILMASAAYLALLFAPEVVSMGDVQRIFYFHVPSAWLCYVGCLISFGGSLAYLYRPSEKSDRIARAGAEVGLFFGYLVIMTGPIWARVSWGVWWKWEPRLTSMVFLVLIFTVYAALQNFSSGTAGKKFAAVLAIFGTPNLYFVHFAVKKMQGLHPKDVVKSGLNTEMRIALYAAFFALLCVFIAFYGLRLKILEDRQTIRVLSKKLSKMENERCIH